MSDLLPLPSTDQSPLATTSPMRLIELAVEKNADPDRLNKLMEMAEQWNANRAAEHFSAMLAKFQGQVRPITKRRQVSIGGGEYTYASLDDIMMQITPDLTACGLSVVFSSEITATGMMHVTCKLRCGTHVEESHITLPVPAGMKVNETQKMGAALSYAKRYALCCALNLIVTDEDVNAQGVTDSITEHQAIQLSEMIESTGANRAKFLEWLGVESIEVIPASKFDTAFQALKSKGAKR